MWRDILNFSSLKSSQLCKLHLMYIVTCMCCNHCNICFMTYLKAMEQGHILTYTLKVHNLGGTKFGKLIKFNTVDTKNWCPWDFRGFLMNWIYLSEFLLGPTWHFFDGQKPQKRAEGFCFGVNFAHFRLPVFCVTLFLENHSIFSHKILYSCSWYNIDGQYIQTMPPVCWGLFGVFWRPILAYVLIFLDICPIFCHEILLRCSWNNSDYH